MDTILRMFLPALQPATSAAIVALTLATTVAVILVIGVARRRKSCGSLPTVILAVGLCSTALASWAGVRMFAAVFEEVTASGGGIGAISSGIWESAQLPLTAAWIAVIASFVAVTFLRWFAVDPISEGGGRSRPAAVGLLLGVALIIGLAPLIAFRPAAAFVLRAITPGTAIPPARVMNYLLAYEMTTAVCFLVMIGIVVALGRISRGTTTSQPVALMVVLALMLTVTVSAFTAAGLRATSERFHDVARYGSVGLLER